VRGEQKGISSPLVGHPVERSGERLQADKRPVWVNGDHGPCGEVDGDPDAEREQQIEENKARIEVTVEVDIRRLKPLFPEGDVLNPAREM
jgi:hypothetical protein